MVERMKIPKGEVHEIRIGFREQISIDYFLEFCYDTHPDSIECDFEYGLVATIKADDDKMEYIEGIYGFAIGMMCDMEQNVQGEPMMWKARESETSTLPIIRCGNSLAINVTKICNVLNVKAGDYVKVTVETTEGK